MEKEDCFNLFAQRAGYYSGLVKRFFKLKAKCSMMIITFTIITQVLTLASFLIPLKMLFFLEKEKLQEISLKFYTITSKEEFVIVFIIGMIMLLMSIQGAEKITSHSKKKCSSDIWTKNKYFQIYEDQEKLAKNIFGQYISSLSNLIFISLILTLLSFLYPIVALTLVIYWLTISLVFMSIFNHSTKLQKKVEEELGTVINNLGWISFLAVFIVVLVDLASDKPSVVLIFAIISLILVRHIIGAIAGSIVVIRGLYNQQNQIETIFFKEYANHNLIDKKQKEFWSIFENDQHKETIKRSLSEALNENISIKKFEWYELEQPNIVALLLILENNEKYLIKIFNKNLHVRVLKENSLLSACSDSGLIISFIGIGMIEKYYCHFYRYDNNTEIVQQEVQASRLILLEKLAKYEVPQIIVDQYITSHKCIYQRFSHEVFNRLRLAANSEDMALLDWFEKERENIHSSLNKLPLRLVIPAINKNTLLKDNNNDVKLLSFDNWMIEPIGFSFTSNPKEMALLKDLLEEEQFVSAQVVQQLKAYELNATRNSLNMAINNLATIRELLNAES